MLYMRELRLREDKWLSQSNTAESGLEGDLLLPHILASLPDPCEQFHYDSFVLSLVFPVGESSFSLLFPALCTLYGSVTEVTDFVGRPHTAECVFSCIWLALVIIRRCPRSREGCPSDYIPPGWTMWQEDWGCLLLLLTEQHSRPAGAWVWPLPRTLTSYLRVQVCSKNIKLSSPKRKWSHCWPEKDSSFS
jgi:hypothetical protein